jgi:hypothetical protein
LLYTFDLSCLVHSIVCSPTKTAVRKENGN